ncbi:trypsin-like peptidase domain-containing protein [Nostoc sp. CHAB 5844]|nr:trypsin-like peptidase domain-containing protein [Nostoc sp. CHAB 5844]
MNLTSRLYLLVALMGAIVMPLVQIQIIIALPATVNNIAQQVTVRIDGANTGSGVIIRRQGNTYTVLTNWHVVAKVRGYNLQTYDSKTHQVNNIRHIGNIDVAEVQFTSTENYRQAELFTEQLAAGTTVYTAGWADPDAVSVSREYVIVQQLLTRVVQRPKDEYALVFSNATKAGMSGGPVLDEQGRLVGIHGQARRDERTQTTDFLGIPINTYGRLAAAQSVKLPQSEVVQPSKPISSVTTETLRTLSGNSARVFSVAYSPDGQTLASGGSGRIIEIWNLYTGKVIRTLSGHSDWVQSIAYSPDGKTLASGSRDKTIKIWNLSTGKVIRTLSGDFFQVLPVAYSPDGKTLAGGSRDKTIKIWNLSTGKVIRTLSGDFFQVLPVAYSPDGKTLASGSRNKTIKIWNLSTGKVIRTLSGHSYSVSSVAYSLDGKTLVSGSYDKTIKIWNLSTGKVIRTLSGHSAAVFSVAYSPDGKTLASGSFDNTIKLWNLSTGELVRSLAGHHNTVLTIAYSPDGKNLASGGYDNIIKIWNLSVSN